MSDCIFCTIDELNPEPVVQQHCQELLSTDLEQRLLCVSYPFESYWLQSKPRTTLAGLYYLKKNKQQIEIHFTVSSDPSTLIAFIENAHEECEAMLFDSVRQHFSLAVFSADMVLSLSCIHIAKPWGQEIWYTGIEERGVAALTDGTFELPLPWVLSALPTSLCADQQQTLILLKVLDPLSEEVFGDLYFELHQQKREVYVVTAIDQDAWPGGEGGIRFGFDQAKRKQYDSDMAFRAAFVAAVAAYKEIRGTIDRALDKCRQRDQVALDAPVSADKLRGWLRELPDALLMEEKQRRSQMDAFTNTLALAVGDVVKVPCLTPHSLQHGVRTIEFQTPVYERLIVSFAQKVLTQPHWDTERAAEIMLLDAPEPPAHDRLVEGEGVLVERIVDFEDFEVLRISLEYGCCYTLATPVSYSLLIGLTGQVFLGGYSLIPEQAALLPSAWPGGNISNDSVGTASFLLANPKS